jgi:hypothetical protein
MPSRATREEHVERQAAGAGKGESIGEFVFAGRVRRSFISEPVLRRRDRQAREV